MRLAFPLHTHILVLSLTVIFLVSGLIGGIGYSLSRDALNDIASDLTQRIVRETRGALLRVLSPAEMATNLLAQSDITESTTLTERWRRIGLICEALKDSTSVDAIYVGYPSGDFFDIQNIATDEQRQTFNAPAATRYILRSIERGPKGAKGTFAFLDQDRHVLRFEDRTDYANGYDPRGHGWFKAALERPEMIRTQPYLFFTDQKVGMTLARRAATGSAVVGTDILLETFGDILAQQKITPGTHIALVNADSYVVGYEDSSRLFGLPTGPDEEPSLKRLEAFGVPVLDDLGDLVAGMAGKPSLATQLRIENDTWHIFISPLALNASGGGTDQPIYLVICIPESELFHAAISLRSSIIKIAFFSLLLILPITWAMARGIAKPLQRLRTEANAIRQFDISRPFEMDSMITEINEVGATMAILKRTIRRFLDISRAVAAEPSFERLLPRLLGDMIAVGDADLGVLYLVDGAMLMPAAVMLKDMSEIAAALAPVAVADPGPVISTALGSGKAYWACLDRDDIACVGLQTILTRTEARLGVAVPLLNRQQHLVGVILLLRTLPIEADQLSFLAALSSSAASSLEARALIKAQRELFEAFIQLIAVAIDAKSAHTAGHCARVPELTKMLAQAAVDQTTGPYKDFTLDDQEWEAVHVAAWLHDCGKVTTPEYVVDKATKLETIYDRIHEIRTRFEVLKCQTEIACLTAILGGADEGPARARLNADLAQIDDEFAFVAKCNEGAEYLDPAAADRLGVIAARTWTRTLDDRIGIAHEEKERKAQTPAPTLPVAEPLLADRPEHIFDRRASEYIPPDNRWGIRMTVPERLYNKGELHNLCIGRGTLSEEERYKINEHIVQTIVMLSQLPFPKHLRQVPEIAAGHHEKMDGTGYPKRLTRDEMSPLARMVAIADIFEALTAIDRPYKPGKTLSESIAIMARMKTEHHIDPDLFDLFLRSGVYRAYAERFMRPEQIDEVDIERYL